MKCRKSVMMRRKEKYTVKEKTRGARRREKRISGEEPQIFIVNYISYF